MQKFNSYGAFVISWKHGSYDGPMDIAVVPKHAALRTVERRNMSLEWQVGRGERRLIE